MRVIKNLAVPQNTALNLPDGGIKNETDTEDGTPVVEEIYGDVLSNIYRLLRVVGITPTENQDNDSTQYQILDALKKLPNVLNDIEQVLTLSGATWNIPFDLDFLPNKYFFVARASEDYVAGSSYSFKGSSATTYQFNSSGFKASDELLVIIDQSTVRAYSLSYIGATSSEVFTVMGTPVAFNDTAKVWYQDGGNLMSDVPSVDYLQNIIRVDVSNGTVLLNDILITNGYALCFCVIPGTNDYFFRQFALTNLSASSAVSIVGAAFSSTEDFSPYVFAKQGIVFISNEMNSNAEDFSLSQFVYNPVGATLTLASTIDLDNSFVKTTNAAIKGDLLYTMISGVLESYNLTSGTKLSLGSYSGAVGQIFGLNGEVYFSSGEVAKKWF